MRLPRLPRISDAWRHRLPVAGVRWLVALLLVLFGFGAVSMGSGDIYGLQARMHGLIMVGCFVAAAVLVVPEGVHLLGAPFLRLIDHLYGGAGPRDRRPPLDYHVADYNLRLGRWAEAARAYGDILADRPREIRAHCGRLTAAGRLGLPPEDWAALLKEARAAARTPEERAAVEAAAAAVAP